MDIVDKKIINCIKKSNGMTISEVASRIKKDRHTTAKYLEKMYSKGIIDLKIFGKSKIYQISDSALINALNKNDELSKELLQVFQALDHEIIIQTKKGAILEKNKDKKKCFEKYLNKPEKCKSCPVDKTFNTGLIHQSKNKNYNITTHPIKKDNKIVAVVEIIKNNKRKK